MTDVAIIRTGAANLASVCAAMDRCDARWRLVETGTDAASADRLVLPGVGSFGAVMRRLDAQGLIDPLRARIESGAPTLCICLGMQALLEGSDESPQAAGLGVAPGRAEAFEGVRRPQLGWNAVEPDDGCALLRPGSACFANSYRLTEAPRGWNVAWAEHGGRFVAAMERGAVLACQFHPELSGAWGRALLERWLALEPAEAPC
ncbi:MAG: imidazole glycerol phosphate synthase subunit HisH [Phycisphaerales bacterium JB039]